MDKYLDILRGKGGRANIRKYISSLIPATVPSFYLCDWSVARQNTVWIHKLGKLEYSNTMWRGLRNN